MNEKQIYQKTAVETIKQLRIETGAGVQDCRKALELFNADFEKALEYLRQQELVKIASSSDRPQMQGIVEVYSHGSGRVGVLVEISCETDFAARSPVVRAFAHEVALQVAAAAPVYVREDEIPGEVLHEEARKAETSARQQGKPEAVIPRIVAGVLEKYKDRSVLLRQEYIRDAGRTVSHLLSQAAAQVHENISIRRVVRWEAGEEQL
jgi:elongation factor Ts